MYNHMEIFFEMCLHRCSVTVTGRVEIRNIILFFLLYYTW